MRGIILEHKKNGVHIMDKEGYFRFIRGFTNFQIGAEIEIPKKNKIRGAPVKPHPIFFPRPALASFGLICACLICIFVARWNIASYYVYVDAIDDIELTFNSMNIVISSTGFNSEGTALLEEENYIGQGRKAIEKSYLAMQKNGFHTSGKDGNEFLEITVSARNPDKAKAISKRYEKFFADSVPVVTNFDYCDLTKRESAIHFGATPCKLLLAERLNRLEPYLDFEEIIKLPMGEIHKSVRYITSQHWG